MSSHDLLTRVRLRVAAMCALAIATATTPLLADSPGALAGASNGLCTAAASRGAVDASFPLDACIASDSVWVRNNLQLPVNLALSGDTGSPVRVSTDVGLAADLTRALDHNPLLLMPGDIMRIPVGSGAASVTIAGTESGGTYALATAFLSFAPDSVVKQEFDVFTRLIAELADDFAKKRDCQAGQNWIIANACQLVFESNVTFAFGRAVVTGLAKGALGVILSADTFMKWANAQPQNVSAILRGTRTVNVAAAPSPAPTDSANTASNAPAASDGSAGSRSGTGAPTAAGAPGTDATETVTVTVGRTAVGATGCSDPSCAYVDVSVSGGPPTHHVSCVSSIDNGAFYSYSTSSADSSVCYFGYGGAQVWAVVDGVRSAAITWPAGSSPSTTPPPTPPAPPATPSVNVSKGASAVGRAGCSDPSCAFVTVTLTGFSPGAHVVQCQSSVDHGTYYQYTTSQTTSSVCYFGYSGAQVWAVVDGVSAPPITW